MKPYLSIAILLFVLCPALVHGQQIDKIVEKGDSIGQVLDKSLQKTDTLQSLLQTTTDSVSLRFNTYQEKLNLPENKIDSIETAFYNQSDSLKQHYKTKLSFLSTATEKLNHKKDSLAALRLPTEKYTRKLDSLMQKQQETVTELNQKVDKLKSTTVGKLNELELPPELKTDLTKATGNIDNFRLPAKDLNITSLNLPDNTLKNLDGLTTGLNTDINIGKIDEIGKLGDVANVNNLTKIDGVPQELGQVSDIGKQAGEYTGDLKNISKGNLNDVKALPETLENKAGELSGLNEVTGQTKVLDQYKDQAAQLQDPAAMKEQAIQKAQEVAIDHFAGKEDVLQQAMNQVAKYKEKYSSLQSLEDAKKRRPNEMRGKPIRERLLPGFGLQIHQKNDRLFDVNPYLGYRFSGRFTSGMGWNQRWAYDKKRDAFRSRGRIFGPRAYAEFNLFKGFFPRFELEAMNTFIPTSFSSTTTDKGQREWIWSAFMGLKKNYRFLKKVNGTSSVMFNLYNPLRKSPYADVVNVRFGFEFPIKKKHRTKK